MSKLKITNITNQNNDGGAVISGISTFSATDALKVPVGTEGERVGIESGSLRYNSTYNTLEFYNGTNWVAFSPGTNSINVRGIFNSYSIDYITISTTGNALSFGNAIFSRNSMGACSSSTRGVFGGGGAPWGNIIDYITIATTGNSSFFGNLTVSRVNTSACSSSTRGVFGGGYSAPVYSNVLDYITIATTGDATDFGDLTQRRWSLSACSSSTRGVFGGGETFTAPVNTYYNVIDYITIASVGNATDFGDLTSRRRNPAACSSSTRGVFGGGLQLTPLSQYANVIDYITIATTGNAIDFGDLSVGRYGLAACSSSTRGVFGGGEATTPIGTSNIIDYITIATTGNALDFGDLTSAVYFTSACSNGHGGLS